MKAPRPAPDDDLLESQKLESIGRLAGGIAHDFNNVLFAIKGYAEMLAEDLGPDRRGQFDPDLALRNVRAIGAAATRGASLTAQLLAFGRHRVVRSEPFDVNDAIERVEPMLRRLIGENVRLVVRPAPDGSSLKADPGQVDLALVNLVINARDAMPEGGTITVEATVVEATDMAARRRLDLEPGAYVVLAVTDTAHGVTDAASGTDGRVGRRAVAMPSTEDDGAGLGLAAIYGIVQEAGGRVRIDTEPGSGSTVRLYFPRVDASAQATEEAAPSAGTGRILVVEDESAVRDLASMVLLRAGHEVTSVRDGREAIAWLTDLREPLDVLVTDVVMPGMSGIELAERLLDRVPSAGVVLLSGYTAETLDLDRVLSRGAVFLPKPVTSTDLLDAVRRSRERKPVAPDVART